jgi:hypothetical protein
MSWSIEITFCTPPPDFTDCDAVMEAEDAKAEKQRRLNMTPTNVCRAMSLEAGPPRYNIS